MRKFNRVLEWNEFVNNRHEKRYEINQRYYKCKDLIINFKDCISFIESKIAELNQTVRTCKDLVKRCHREIKNHESDKHMIKIKKTAEHQWIDANAIQEISDNCKEMKDECWKLSKQWRTVEDLDQYMIESNKKMEEYYQYLSSIDDMMTGYQTITDELQGIMLELENKHFDEVSGPFKIPEIRNIIMDQCVEVDAGSISQIAQLNKFWNNVVTSQEKYKEVIETEKQLDQINNDYWDDFNRNDKCMTSEEWDMCYLWESNSKWGYDPDDYM